MNRKTFQVGQRVMIKKDKLYRHENTYGTIVWVKNGDVQVQFDKPNPQQWGDRMWIFFNNYRCFNKSTRALKILKNKMEVIE